MPEDRPTHLLLVALGLNLAVGGAVGLLLALSQGATGPAHIARSVAIALVHANLIGLPAWFAIDRLMDRLRARSAALRWAAVGATIVVLTALGCLAAGLLFTAIGWFDPQRFWGHVVFSARIALVVGLICTVSGTFWDRLRARADAARLAEARALTRAAEARMNALEARVHPHFLFNALNSVLSLIPEDPARAEALLEQVSALLRFALDAGQRGRIPLGDELRIVRGYLELEAARLGDRLRAEVAIEEPGLESWPVPPFAVQTLVENSVRHSIAPRRAGGAVRLAIRRCAGDDELQVTVWDDGPGFARADVPAGRGLENLEGRLRALYGERGRIRFDRGRGPGDGDGDGDGGGGGGMTVAVEVPR